MFGFNGVSIAAVAGLVFLVVVLNGSNSAKNIKIETLEGQITTVNVANKTLIESNEKLKQLRLIESTISIRVNAELSEINQRLETQTKTLDELEKQNAALKNYLDAALPNDVKRLLNGETGNSRGPR